jgi:hypothetical protein
MLPVTRCAEHPGFDEDRLPPAAVFFSSPGRCCAHASHAALGNDTDRLKPQNPIGPSPLELLCGLIDAASRCIADQRNPLLIKHALHDMLRQRVCVLPLGWQDLNDHGALRQDVVMQTAVGVDRKVAGAPRCAELEKWADLLD